MNERTKTIIATIFGMLLSFPLWIIIVYYSEIVGIFGCILILGILFYLLFKFKLIKQIFYISSLIGFIIFILISGNGVFFIPQVEGIVCDDAGKAISKARINYRLKAISGFLFDKEYIEYGGTVYSDEGGNFRIPFIFKVYLLRGFLKPCDIKLEITAYKSNYQFSKILVNLKSSFCLKPIKVNIILKPPAPFAKILNSFCVKII
jgi:hypothetical protein